ncbi:MAG: STAS domain-containing protein [Acidobacteria bacterium]|nr:STAS domain-containing protein [Acidobacteriota bacterium]
MSSTTITTNEDGAIVQPAGDVTATSAPELRSALKGVIAGGARAVTVDFSNVQMLDSAGIGLLIATHNSLAKVSGKLSVVRASAEIMDLFQMMRIHQHFSVSGE